MKVAGETFILAESTAANNDKKRRSLYLYGANSVEFAPSCCFAIEFVYHGSQQHSVFCQRYAQAKVLF
jgi:hypothetical protein